MNNREWIDFIEKVWSSVSLHMSRTERRRHASSILLSAKMKGIAFEDWNPKSDLFADANIEVAA